MVVVDDEALMGRRANTVSYKRTNDGRVVEDKDGAPPLVFPTSYNDADRGLLARILESKSIQTTLTARFSYGPTPLSTVTLFDMSHISGSSNGESFVTQSDLWESGIMLRVANDQSLKVDIAAIHNDQVQSISALEAATQVAKIAQSEFKTAAPFLSALDTKNLEKKAKVWDRALAQASSTKAEEHASITLRGQDLNSSNCGVVRLTIPGVDKFFSSQLDSEILVGDWVFSTNENKICSVFIDSVTTCIISPNPKKAEPKHENPTFLAMRILDTPLGGEPAQTILGYVLGDKSIQPKIDALQKAASKAPDWHQPAAATGTNQPKPSTDAASASAAADAAAKKADADAASAVLELKSNTDAANAADAWLQRALPRRHPTTLP